jgi:hypothetical protein
LTTAEPTCLPARVKNAGPMEKAIEVKIAAISPAKGISIEGGVYQLSV